MSYKKAILSVLIFIQTFLVYSQNLPSLLTGKNINSTFSIVAYDDQAKEWGIAVATNNIYVGSSTIYIQPELGAFSVIAETEPRYAIEGFEKLKAGKSIQQAILEVKNTDDQANYRQVSGIDATGNVFAFTGKSLKYWKGNASTLEGDKYVVMGNQLEEEVIIKMSSAFENAKGTLAQKLMNSLVAGQNAGGQITGKQSAAVVVKGTNNEWFNQIDLRVDHSQNPIEDLQVLMDYHYGRIRLNQALFANSKGNVKRAKEKLRDAESMLNGWDGMYPRLAVANILMKNEEAAIDWIYKGLAENGNWHIHLPAFYVLRDHPKLRSIIVPGAFSVRDWESAIGMLSNLGKELEIIDLAKKLKEKDIDSSYLRFLIGRSYFYEKDTGLAIKHLKDALKMDRDNVEAQNLLEKIQSK